MAGEDTVDLVALAATRGRPIWSHQSEDLDINLLVLVDGEAVPKHINLLVDVLIVGIAGEGSVDVDGVERLVAAGRALVVPKRVSRAIQVRGARFAYLSCHRRRPGLRP
jgi:mannose-6-phosphate isomerase-like protein (cupin superfamily)